MGTDAGVGRHGDNAEELPAMVSAGMTPVAALHAATGSAADLLRLESDIGYVREGNVADLLLVQGPPPDLVGFSSQVSTVIQGGTVVHRRAVRPANDET
jgi:tryptophan 2-monooxygenase